MRILVDKTVVVPAAVADLTLQDQFKLGEGGMGAVHRATDTKSQSRRPVLELSFETV
jgi:hypothetical protein